MKFRIKKEDGIYFGEYKSSFMWWYVPHSVSSNIEKTKEVCKQFFKTFEKTKVVEIFEL